MDIAKLGLVVDSSGVVRAAINLDTLSKASKRLVEESNKAGSAMQTGSKAAQGYGTHMRAAARNADDLTHATALSRAGAINLTAQFNDIAVMMLSGQNPFVMAAQQGTHVSQVLNMMVGEAKGFSAQMRLMGPVLKTAFLSFLNPISVGTIAIIALAGASFQFFRNWVKGGEEAKRTAKELADAIQEIVDQTQEARTEFDKLLFGSETTEEAVLQRRIAEINARATILQSQGKTFWERFWGPGVSGESVNLQYERMDLQEKLRLLDEARRRVEEANNTSEQMHAVQMAHYKVQGDAVRKLAADRQQAAQEEAEDWLLMMQMADSTRGLIQQLNSTYVSITERIREANNGLSISERLMLVMAGVPLSEPVSDAAAEALRLAQNLGLSFQWLQSMIAAARAGGGLAYWKGVVSSRASGTGVARPNQLGGIDMGGSAPTVGGAMLPVPPSLSPLGWDKKGGRGGGISDEARDAARIFEETRTEMEKYNAEMAVLKAHLDAGRISADTYHRAIAALNEEYRDRDGLKEWREATQDLADSMASAWVASKGLFSGIGPWAKQAARELMASGLHDLMWNLFPQSQQKRIGGGGILSGIWNAFFPGRDVGGHVSAGEGYVVGERGRERFFPGRSGMVVPEKGGMAELVVRAAPGITIEEVRNETDMRIRLAAPAIEARARESTFRQMQKTKMGSIAV